MKTTKKGFTLIELIVVIAIIGVLAAILVPAMLGYVKKSKIQSANSAANTMLKAANSALEEIDEDDAATAPATNMAFGNDGAATHSTSAITINALSHASAGSLEDYITYYSDDAKTAKYGIYIKDGVAVAAVAKSGRYYGTSPIVFTNKTYDDYMDGVSSSNAMETALGFAVDKYEAAHS